MTIDMKKLQQEMNKFVTDRDWDQFHSVKNLSMALSVECSELVEIFQWMKEEKSNSVSSDPETLGKVKDELADIFFYLMRIVDKTGIDLEEAVLSKIKKNEEKYPVEKSRGTSKKYDEL
jgi:dCTP diphosphatase